jgi:hypothetical protein
MNEDYYIQPMTTLIWRKLDLYFLILFISNVRATAALAALPLVNSGNGGRSTAARRALYFSLSSVRSALGVSVGDDHRSSNSNDRSSFYATKDTERIVCRRGSLGLAALWRCTCQRGDAPCGTLSRIGS